MGSSFSSIPENNLKTLEESIYRLKILFRQGWLGNVPRGEIESVADHSYAVATLGFLLTPIENELRIIHKQDKQNLDELKILKLALLHDFGESQYLDIDKRTINLLGIQGKDIKTKLEHNAAKNLQNQLGSYVQDDDDSH